MGLFATVLSRAMCAVALLAPIIAIVVYPKANWLFAFPIIGVALLLILARSRKDPPPSEVADWAERILTGTYGGYDVDDYEHLNPKDPLLKELWTRTLMIHGLPEEWIQLEDQKKTELREVIAKIRELPGSN